MITDVSFLDWSIVIIFVFFLFYVTQTTQKHTKSVADFMSANRCAGRYLLGTSEGMAIFGAASIIAHVELYTRTGFSSNTWGSFSIPILLFMYLSGWVFYRFRATRALTIAQFFEMRYSRKFRLFAGIITWLSGILNFGIFPGIGARFFIMWLGLENHIISVGPMEINLTLAAVMLVLLGIALFFTYMGGQIAVLVTDFWQGLISGWIILVLIALVLVVIGWDRITEALLIASKPGDSFVDPIDIAGKKDFNIWYFLIIWFFIFFQQGCWQGTQGYNTSALTPHESKMGKVIGQLRMQNLFYLLIIVIALTGITFLNHPDFAEKGKVVTNSLKAMFSNESERGQMFSPMSFRLIMPKGLVGLFAITVLGFFISTNNTYMHSWGSIFVQDVICPLKKKPFEQRTHLLLLRASIAFVTVFAFLFSLLFPMKEYIVMFMQITMTIYIGGASAVLIGGLYWKCGTTLGAWSAMITGCGLATATIILRTAWEHIPFCVDHWGSELPINSAVMSFWSVIAGYVVYVVVSLIDNQKPIDMDKLFHRGKYAIEAEEQELKARGAVDKPVGFFWKLIGVNGHEFTSKDKMVFLLFFLTNMLYFGLNLILFILALFGWMTPKSWLYWHRIMFWQQVVLSVGVLVWVSIGGLMDLKRLYQKLKTVKRDLVDDGRVLSKYQLGKQARKIDHSDD